jgi:predicted NAD/FAD-binding protein
VSRIAVIGGGIAGLSAAWLLSRRHEVHLFEREMRLGGHTNTVTVETDQGPLALDTGFLVHNDRTYPNLVRLFRELGVETRESDMSFAVSNRRSGFEWSSRGLRGFFADPRNLVRPSHYRLLREILRFNREAPGLLLRPDADALTLGDWVAGQRFSDELLEHYLYPMAAAIWSASPEAIHAFPALTLVRFFDNHGLLGLDTHPRWKVVSGGSSRYLEPITRPFRRRVHLGVTIRSVARTASGVELRLADRASLPFDEVVFACHGDQVLPLLADPSGDEREVFAGFRTSRNDTWLHTDASLLPQRRVARASWNYLLGESAGEGATVTYHLNRLQGLATREEYCVTLNPPAGAIDPERVLARMTYRHPLYTRDAIRSQARWGEVSGRRHTHFCGAYWLYGFHEDGLASALRVARALGVDWHEHDGIRDLPGKSAAPAVSSAAA